MRTRATPPASACAQASSLAAMPPPATPDATSARASSSGSTGMRGSRGVEHAGHVRQQEQLGSAERGGDGRRGIVAIHVQRAADRLVVVRRHRRDHRQEALRQQRIHQTAIDVRPACRRGRTWPRRWAPRAAGAASSPEMPTAGAPAAVSADTSCLLASPDSTMRTSSSTPSVVTRRPPTNTGSSPRSRCNVLIWSPPPCTIDQPAAARGPERRQRRRQRRIGLRAAAQLHDAIMCAALPSRRDRTSGWRSGWPGRRRPSRGCRWR